VSTADRLAHHRLANHRLIGVLGGTGHARVDARGALAPGTLSWRVDWWIGADDRWHVPAREAAVRQSLVDGMPVVRTAMRVPGGDAVQQVAALPEPDELVVVDVADESPAPFVLALVVHDACSVEIDGTSVYVDGRLALRPMRAPSRWATGTAAEVEAAVTGGDASDGPFVPVRDPAGTACAALLFPVAHRTTFRVAVALEARGMHDLDPAVLPAPESVARGWRAQLARGMRVELPEAALQDAIDTARAEVLLEAQVPGAGPGVVAALEDWGFDAEARAGWSRLNRRDRKQAATRDTAMTWETLRGSGGRATPDGAALLVGVRQALVGDAGETIDLLPTLPADWRGASLDVRDAPIRRGAVSFSVRWHGERPALLWDAPAGTTVRAPSLDAAWSTTEPTGEALLGG
jgi:hypothetical protein